MKKLSKDQIEKRKRIKQYLLRSLHIVSYVLSVLFIIVCIVVGVQSCGKKKESNNVNKIIHDNLNLRVDSQFDNIIGAYELKYNGTANIPYANLHQPCVDLGYNTADPGSKVQLYSNPNGLYFYTNTELTHITNIYYELYSFSREGVVEFAHYALVNVSFYDDNNVNVGFVTGKYVSQGDYIECSFTMDFKLIFTEEFNEDLYFNTLWVNPFCNKVDYSILNFDFNNQINYNGSFNASLSSPYIPYSNLSTNIDLPYFISGGNIYNRIHLQFTDAQGSAYLDNSNKVFTLVAGTNIYMTYLYMEYVNTYNGLTTLVNNRDFGVSSNNNNVTRYHLNSSSWVSTNYKHLTFLFGIDNDDLNTITKFNSNTSNVNVGYTSSDIGLGNVFSLLSSAFSGLIGLFSIQLIPGITIGILLFMPLIVGIIIVIVKLVKK